MDRKPIDELLHRVNNLLGTIQMQVAAARAADTKAALQAAMRLIAESAARTEDEIRRFRSGGGDGDSSVRGSAAK